MKIKSFTNKYAFSCNAHVITNGKATIVIDPGFYNGEFKEYLKSLGHVDAILLTHGHWDHIKGLDDLKEDYKNAKIYIYKDEYDFLKDPKLNCSSLDGFELIINSDAEKIDQGNIKILDYDIEVIASPGHTKGSVMYYLKDANSLFTGDTIIRFSIGRTDMPTGSDQAMVESLTKFVNLNLNKDTHLYFGHDESSTYQEVLEKNKFIHLLKSHLIDIN